MSSNDGAFEAPAKVVNLEEATREHAESIMRVFRESIANKIKEESMHCSAMSVRVGYHRSRMHQLLHANSCTVLTMADVGCRLGLRFKLVVEDVHDVE